MEKQQRRKGRGSLQGAPPAGRVFQIRNTQTGRILLRRTLDLRGSETASSSRR